MSKHKCVTVNRDWCEIDQLDGVTLKNGEWVEALWPDGKRKRYQISVIASSYQTTDHGHPWTIPVERAFIDLSIHGMPITIGLRDTKLRIARCSGEHD